MPDNMSLNKDLTPPSIPMKTDEEQVYETIRIKFAQNRKRAQF